MIVHCHTLPVLSSYEVTFFIQMLCGDFMKKLSVLLALVFSCLVPLGALAQSEASGSMVMEFDLSHQAQNEEVKLWIPYPVSDKYQQVTDIKVVGDFAESAIYTDQKYSTPMLFARWNKDAKSRKVQLQFNVVRQEVVKKDFPKVEAAWDPADYSLYLEATRLGPIDGDVEALAKSIVVGKTTVLAKAQAIYEWVCLNMYRDPETRGCGAGDVCALLATPGGKCTDINSVFIALARSVGVPARELFGVRLGKEDVVDVTGWQHCWAEFFLPGYGWVPVDPADVRKMMLKGNLGDNDKETAKLKEYFFGSWDAYRVQVAQGRDIILNPAQAGEPLNTFGYPYAEVGGASIDWLDPAKFTYKITYRK